MLQPWAGGTGVGLGLLAPKISLLDFYLPLVDVGPARSTSSSLLPVRMDVVSLVPLLSDLISVGSEQWWFCILVVTLMWLCEEAAMSACAAV